MIGDFAHFLANAIPLILAFLVALSVHDRRGSRTWRALADPGGPRLQRAGAGVVSQIRLHRARHAQAIL